MYFKLNANSIFIKGGNCSVIYNAVNGTYEEIPSESAGYIEFLENGNRVEDFEEVDIGLLKKLESLELGKFYDNNVYVDKVRYGNPHGIYPIPTKVSKIYIQISEQCNLDCYFCNDTKVNRVTGCKIYKEDGRIDKEAYIKFINSSYLLGCRNMYILGGEPLLHKDLVSILIKTAHKRGYDNIYIYTNAFLLDSEFLSEHEQVNYIVHTIAHNESMFSKITESTKFNEYENNIRLINKENLFFNLLITPHTYQSREDIIEYLKAFEPKGMICSYIFEETNDDTYNSIIMDTKFRSNCISDMQFFNNVNFHPCLNNMLTLFSNGDVGVCPMMRDDTIGNISEMSLEKILYDKKQEQYWELPLKDINYCGDCGYRIICNDCRAIEASQTGNLYGKKYCKMLQGMK